MTSLKLFSLRNVKKACSLLAKCWITIVALWKYVGEIWERIKEFQSNLKTLANLRTNVAVMAEAVLPGYGKIILLFLYTLQTKFSPHAFIFLLHVVN